MRLKGFEDLATTAGAAYLTGGASLATEGAEGMLSSGAPGSGGGGESPLVSTTTTISPTFQQSFTPQVSPVIQVSQDGGSQSASTTQRVLGSQQAKGGDADSGGALAPPSPYASEYNASPGFFDAPQPGNFFDSQNETFDSTFQESGGGMPNALPWIIGAGAALAAWYYFAGKPAL